jgi:hypothetical protein
MKNMKIPTLLVLLGTPACMGDETNALAHLGQGTSPLHAPTDSPSTEEMCRSLMRRQRACGDSFIPALVDARVQSNNPPGIRARSAEVGRDALIKEALDEWSEDSTDESFAALCGKIVQGLSADKDAELRASTGECLGTEGCEAFVSCAVPINLIRWSE